MQDLFAIVVLAIFASLPAYGRELGQAVAIENSAISFVFEDQDGQMNYPCVFSLIEAAQDFDVKCTRADQPSVKWSFTVHARVFSHPHTTSPKMSYELLYWITDHQVASGSQGKYPGTTLWLNLDEPSQLASFEIAQDIETTWALKMHLELKRTSPSIK
jgi:hypothetical protein